MEVSISSSSSSSRVVALLFHILMFLISSSASNSPYNHESFRTCLSNHSLDDHSQIPIHLPNTLSYNSILNTSGFHPPELPNLIS
ncbi:hypothetical protein Scep_022841 [Stephania cephalantha]|uniref:Uncharacterized protein n=1 Tax=Stephania cephalantha TaxID=152367 RepID=A0AAP0F8T6_9MAGN